MTAPKYPFIPKSTSLLVPGQFWTIPLRNGRFACGRVLQLKFDAGKRDPRVFLAGLMNWSSTVPPTADAMARATVIEQGAAHLKTIRENDGVILGLRPLEADGIGPNLFLDQSPGPGCHVTRGFEVLGMASQKQLATLAVFSTWGYGVIKLLAEKHFGE